VAGGEERRQEPAHRHHRRDGADERQGQAEQDDEGRHERAQGQHHDDVDGQDGHAHREEQAPEGLVHLRCGTRERDRHVLGDGTVGAELIDEQLRLA